MRKSMTPERKVERAARVRNCLEALEAHRRSLKPNGSPPCGNAKSAAHGLDAGLSAGMTLKHWSFGDDESRPGKELVEWMLDVMWDNTGPSMAVSSLGWERNSKRDELCASSSRILVVYGAFLNPIESTALVSLFRNVADVRAVAYGGYKDAERRMVAFMRRDMEDTAGLNDPGLEDASESNEQLLRNLFGPFQTLLNVSGNFLFDAASHRDFLGATLQTGIERDVVGDIIVLGDRGAQMVVSESVASHLCAALTQVRTVPVQCRIAESWDELKVRPVSKKEISSVEASLRVDAVASAGFGISRSKMLNFIKSGAVSINWKECSSASTTLKEGDFVTVRGKGKMVLEEVQVTAKERFRVRMSRFT